MKKEKFSSFNDSENKNNYSEDTINQTREMLEKATQKKGEKYSFHEELSHKEREEAEALLEKINDHLLDDKSNFLTNIDRGTESEIFYRILAEEIPDLGISIDEKAKMSDGTPLPPDLNLISIKTIPFKTDRQFVDDLNENPIIDLLKNSEYSTVENKEKNGLELEEEGFLPRGTTSRLLSRDYKYKLKRHPDLEKIFEKRYAKFKNVEPLSDKEIRELMLKVIMEEYKKKL